MKNTPKPPMVVWLTGKQLPCVAVSLRYSTWAEQGPYIHIDKFLAEVEAVADSKHHVDMRNYGNDFMDAVRELSKEIKEGK